MLPAVNTKYVPTITNITATKNKDIAATGFLVVNAI